MHKSRRGVAGRRIATALIGLCVLLVGFAGPAFAKRVALVIGNNAYANLPELKKSANDARSVAAALEDMGFSVLLGTDLTRRETNRKLADLEAAIAPGDEVFFFFAGHGVALGAENYLLPTDMPKPRQGEDSLVRDEGHAVTDLVVRMQSRGAAATFFVLDACRDNPFEQAGVRSIGNARGLARVDTPSGVFVLFSAGIGQSALDRLSDADENPNSVFTRELVPLLETPGLSHVTMAKRLQEEVSALAATVHHRQQPAYYDQILGEIVLNPEEADTSSSPASGPPAATSDAARTWKVIAGTESPAVLQAFIDEFPDSVFANFARARLTELAGSSEPEPKAAAPPEEIAALAPAEPAPPRGADDQELVRSIQDALNRQGCDAGGVDGVWGAKSRKAARDFAKAAGLSVDPEPSEALLAALDSHKDSACPTPPREREAAVQPAPAPAPAPEEPPTKTFNNPMLAGLPVDICVSWKKGCKGEAAAAFCRQQGYSAAVDSRQAIYPETRHISNGETCTPTTFVRCGGYSVIVCAR